MDQPIAILLSVESGKYDEDHPAWRGQVNLLWQRLREVDDGEDADIAPVLPRLSVEPDTEPWRGGKGLVEVSAIVLSSAHVIRAAALVLRRWREQDKTRKVTVKLRRGDETIEIEGMGGTGVNAAQQMFLAALENPDMGELNPGRDGTEG